MKSETRKRNSLKCQKQDFRCTTNNLTIIKGTHNDFKITLTFLMSFCCFQVNCAKKRKQDHNIAKELRMMGHGEHTQTGLTTK
jgi:hypothetical protein